MGSNAFLFLGICLAIFAMISSKVVAVTCTTSEEYFVKSDNKNEEHGGGHGRYKFVEIPKISPEAPKEVAKEAAKHSAAHSVVAKEIRLRDLALIVLGSSLFVFI
ncbi:glycine-rich protein-like [Lycium ferocissimum]|uniref:glycine-rich protein-like n=1 Tax=Lycium ferocissimum TaxID=112874 RepID=UPI002816552A|nr:glycine-rich protein-like [Lycium ferocissimum]